jgi:hypothetical protein
MALHTNRWLDLWGKLDGRKVATRLNRSYAACARRAHMLGLSPLHRRWNFHELHWLHVYVRAGYTYVEIGRLLRRPPTSVASKVHELGINGRAE